MIIQQPAQQLPPVAVKTLLKLGVREPRGVRPVQEAHQRLELLTAGSEPSRHGRIAARAAAHLTSAAPSLPGARQAGVHRPRRKVRHNGCRDRRSRWPPPWSTLDMSNADFDTRSYESSAPARSIRGNPPANGLKTPAQRPTAQPRKSPPSDRPTPPPAATGDSPKPPYLQGIHRQFRPPRRVPSEEPHPKRIGVRAVRRSFVSMRWVVEVGLDGRRRATETVGDLPDREVFAVAVVPRQGDRPATLENPTRSRG